MLLDSKTAATIAKIAVQAVRDDETRNKIIFISLAPIISVLLILAFIVYILTSPLETINRFFFGNELNQVKNIRSQYGYEQLINPNDNSPPRGLFTISNSVSSTASYAFLGMKF